jgi:rubrerythrin
MSSRTRRILDVLDSLAGTTSLADPPNTSNTNDMSSTRKWLHDISVGRSSSGGPPRTTLRTPSRLYSIISNIRDKPYWKRPTEMAAAAAAKKKEVSFEIDSEPVESEAGTTKKVNNSELPKTHQPVLKSYTGRNVAGSLKSNTFNTNFVDLEADVSSETTKKALESVKLPAELGKNIENGFLTKNRVFNFAKPVIRGPQAVVETSFEKEESSSDESSMDDDEEESDKEIETVSAKAINSDTSTSSPENSKVQKAPSPGIKQLTPFSNVAGDSWECSTCMVRNASSADKCPCCETPKEGTTNNAAAPASTFKATEFKPVAASSYTFGFKPAAPSLTTPAPTLFETTPASSIFGTTPAPSVSALEKQNDSAVSKPVTSSNIFGFKPAAPSLTTPAPTPFGTTPAPSIFGTTPAPSVSALEKQNDSSVSKPVDDNRSAPQDVAKPASSTPFSTNTGPVSGGFNFGGSQQPATNGTFQFSSSNSSNNLFNLPLNGSSQTTFSAPSPSLAAPAPSIFGTTPASSFSALGQQNNSFMPKTVDANNSEPQDVSKPVSSTPFSFNTGPVSGGFNFGGNQQPATNGTFQFSSSNSSNNLFNLPLNGASQTTFSSPAPSFPTLGQQNAFMPVTGGSNSSNSRKLLLAKRKKR